jgi:hypothetical protein
MPAAIDTSSDGICEAIADRHAVHQRAHRNPGQDVDGRDDDAGNGIALDELHGAVHRAMQLRFLFQRLAAALGLVRRDDAGAQIGVDAHLLARHGIEREPCAHFRHALRALGDHDELHDGNHQEHHAAHHKVVADHQLAEGVDHVARVGLQQDQLA